MARERSHIARGRSRELWGVLAAFLLALFLRLVPARNAFVEGGIQFFSYDSFYHMRRIVYTVENFPSTLWFDSYLNHPHGLDLTWPPLFDQMIAAFSLLLGGSSQAVDMAAAVAPPVLGSLMIVALYLLAKKLFGTKVALLSAFLLAIDSKHIARTIFGLPDHDPLELLFFLGALLLLAYALTERNRWPKYAVPAGVLIAATAYTWLGTPAYMAALLVYGALQIALDLKEGRSSEETILPLAAAFGVALLLLLPFWDEPWLKPSFFGAVGSMAALAFFFVLSRLFFIKNLPWQAFLPTVAASSYIAFILSYTIGVGGEIRSLFRSGIGYFGGGDLARVGIEEAMPIFSVYNIFSLPGLGLLFALAGLVILIFTIQQSGFRRDQMLFLVWALFSTAMMVSQARFLFLFSISGAILVCLLFFWVGERVRSSVRLEKVDSEAREAGIGIFLLILLLPAAASIPGIAEYRPAISGDWHETLIWLKENTPPTEGFDTPVMAGDYGVMSWWDYGNWILYQSERPVVANNFQAGAEDSARFLLSENEEAAISIADARGVRYVITSQKIVYRKLPFLARWIDEDPGSYVQISKDSDIVSYHHFARFMKTMLAKLHLLDGSTLGHFRLIYESQTTDGLTFPVSQVKVFEGVEGAKITGTTPYSEPMGLILEMRSNQGRSFQYHSSAMPVDGRYEIVVPYSTEVTDGVSSVGPYLLGPLLDVAGGEARGVDVSEEDVLEGRTIVVDF
ncbi:STT3 domain-containing protein [Methanotrichaceae archaeon M04Ac]|uniref:dolichyl-phosphooligosaccharide-protein glycotransferase n=1 Tax=Candidatus Methanocrinis alkalitolerans TaxID=3033395 RepID=A0ABT5XGL1_9EURY|nr:STT3 domain-containing protein [Candidatus Methanocrinis alkalitolerans]MCR3883737.1 glycosyltransferase family 39 protein [Methanothrix sp.]MDF0593766.1 STT3 domain-containing protein [Candidatus Methanocrinis alkalitolerans]